MKTLVEKTHIQWKKQYIYTLLTGILLFSLCSILASSIPGTFAWFTSETEATGTIQNASTADLLTIQTSDITYEANGSVRTTLSIKNISELDTTVRVSVVTSKGEQMLTEQHVNPNETVVTNPEVLSIILANEHGIDHIEYRIQAFINFVNESFIVAVDPSKLINAPAIVNYNRDQQSEEVMQEEGKPTTQIETQGQIDDGVVQKRESVELEK